MQVEGVTQETAIALASDFRTRKGKPDAQGVVLLFNGNAVTWDSTRSDAALWRPGVIAVAPDGECHITHGKNSHGPAQEWRPLWPATKESP